MVLCVITVAGTTCGYNQFRCNNGECIFIYYRCDGGYDCSDESDEASCTAADLGTVPGYKIKNRTPTNGGNQARAYFNKGAALPFSAVP